jgi:hypothetical protein
MARLNFAREHRNWDREWHNVLFTDDLRFCLTNNDRRNPTPTLGRAKPK